MPQAFRVASRDARAARAAEIADVPPCWHPCRRAVARSYKR